MGIAMGTSEAAGYVNRDGQITGWLNELAFATGGSLSFCLLWTSGRGTGGVVSSTFLRMPVIRLALKAGDLAGWAPFLKHSSSKRFRC